MWDLLLKGLNKTCVDVFGESEGVMYVYREGSQVKIQAIFDKNFMSVDPDTGATIITTTPMISIVESSLNREPLEGDQVIIKGTTYRVMEPQRDSEGMIKLVLHEV